MIKTPELLIALRGHYIPESTDLFARTGGVFAHEVSANGEGPARRADAIYAGFTSASGRVLVGHELKVSRADWRAELTKIGKADAWADACHAWYVVAPSTDIVPVEELPEGWGLMLPPRRSNGKRMQIAVKAAVKKDHDPPWWAVRAFCARLETLEYQARNDEVQKKVQARVEQLTAERKPRQAPAPLDVNTQLRLQQLDQIEQMLNGTVMGWRDNLENGRISGQTLARAIRIAADMKDSALDLQNLEHSLGQAQRGLEKLQETIPQIQAAIGFAETEC